MPRPPLLLIAALLLPLACSVGMPPPTYGEEDPLGSGEWTTVMALPAWVRRPTAEGEQHRFVTRGRSNALPIAAPRGLPVLGPSFKRRLTGDLTGALGEQLAGSCAELVASHATPLARASKEELLSRELTPGNTLATAWTLWELDLDALVAELPAEQRDTVRRALVEVPLGGEVGDD